MTLSPQPDLNQFNSEDLIELIQQIAFYKGLRGIVGTNCTTCGTGVNLVYLETWSF